nr:hypothetical protein Iba_chr13cCG11430 [Ipomoea batatas]
MHPGWVAGDSLVVVLEEPRTALLLYLEEVLMYPVVGLRSEIQTVMPDDPGNWLVDGGYPRDFKSAKVGVSCTASLFVEFPGISIELRPLFGFLVLLWSKSCSSGDRAVAAGDVLSERELLMGGSRYYVKLT